MNILSVLPYGALAISIGFNVYLSDELEEYKFKSMTKENEVRAARLLIEESNTKLDELKDNFNMKEAVSSYNRFLDTEFENTIQSIEERITIDSTDSDRLEVVKELLKDYSNEK